MKNKLQFKVDFINGIVPLTRVDSFFESLKNIDDKFDLSNWVKSCFAVRGIRNYNTRYHFQGKNDFIVSWNSPTQYDEFIAECPEENKFNPYIYITISGSGIDLFSNNLIRFRDYLYRVGFKCTRLDSACDIFNRDNDIVSHILQSFKFNSKSRKPEGVPFVVSNMSLEAKKIKSTGRYKRPVQYTTISDCDGNMSTNLTFGDHSSYLGMFRCYDKYLERGLDIIHSNPLNNDSLIDFQKKLYPDRYCYRLEVELHKNHASALFNIWAIKKLELYDLFASALVSMFNVKISKSSGYQQYFCEVSPIWKNFLDELSMNIHSVQFEDKSSVPVVELPIEELKEKLLHYAPMLCAYEDLCEYDTSFRIRVNSSERYRYENKIQYQYLRNLLSRKQLLQSQQIII